MIKFKRAALFFIILLGSGLQCSDSGKLFGSEPPLPGTDNAYAFGSGGGDISLVSLIFPFGGEIESVSAVDRITGDLIRFDYVETGDQVVVTLQLLRGQLVNPRLVFNGELSFTALLTPEHGLSTFDGLTFGEPTMFLRDHGVERELELGQTAVILSEDFTRLWVGDRLTDAARMRFLNLGDAGDFTLQTTESSQTLVLKRGRLETKKTVELGNHEGAAVIVAPLTGAEVVSVSVTN